MKNNIRLCPILLFIILPFCLFSQKVRKVEKATTNDVSTFIDVNKLLMWVSNNGEGSSDPTTGGTGLYYPKGKPTTLVYADGVLWSGKVILPDGKKEQHSGGAAYRSSLQAGKILTNGSLNGTQYLPPVAENAALEKNRIYKIRNDIPSYLNPPISLQYQIDYDEWPIDDGAPSENNKPKFIGDQTLFYVSNCLDSVRSFYLYGSKPTGLEIQTTIFGFKQTQYTSVVFIRKLLINKSGLDIDSMYFSQWSDPDLGFAGDDLTGVDTLLNLGYCYNGDANDNGQYGLNVPAVGYQFIQTPKIKTDNNSNHAGYLGKKISGYKNVPLSSFAFFIGGGPNNLRDPELGQTRGTTTLYNYQQGLDADGFPLIDYSTGKPTKFMASGDPVAKTGDLDGKHFAPSDRRMLLSTGPFSMSVGDTQEVIIAVLVGQGTDYLNSVTELKKLAVKAQTLYDKNFVVPGPPPSPKVEVIEQNGKIVLNWSDEQTIEKTETDNQDNFRFQGYKVYQLPSKDTQNPEEAYLIGTFDLRDGITKVHDNIYDFKSDEYLTRPVHYGTDRGLVRSITLTSDFINGGSLTNNREYYYAVTAYNVYNDGNGTGPEQYLAAGNFPTQFESPLQTVTAIPKPNSGYGYLYSAATDSSLTVTRFGKSDGQVSATVIDPAKLTGDHYRVEFFDDKGTTKWRILNLTKNDTLFAKGMNEQLTTDTNLNSVIVDGLMISVSGSLQGIRDWSVPSGTRRFTWSGADGFGFEGFNGAIGAQSPQAVNFDGTNIVKPSELKKVLIKLAMADTAGVKDKDFDVVFNPNDQNVSYAYRYLINAAQPAKQARFSPFISSTAGDGFVYQEFSKSVPIAAYDMEDSNNPRRLALAFTENNSDLGLVNGKYWPGNNTNLTSNTDLTSPREWLFILDETYSETPNPVNEVNLTATSQQRVMYFLTVNRRGAVPFSPQGTGTDQFEIVPNYINSPAVSFEFTAPAPPVFSEKAAKSSLQNVNVYPNPYLGSASLKPIKFERKVTFTNLPPNASIRIFTIGGVFVRELHSTQTQRVEWDLTNSDGRNVASGVYIAFIQNQFGNRTLKLALLQTDF